MAGGVGGASVADGAPASRDPLGLGVALDCATLTDITLDTCEAGFRVLITGLLSIDLPVSPHLTDLQPSGEWNLVSYLSLSVVVRLVSNRPCPALGVESVELYGSLEYADTNIILEPGQWVG